MATILSMGARPGLENSPAQRRKKILKPEGEAEMSLREGVMPSL
jgi:hypothetical protein